MAWERPGPWIYPDSFPPVGAIVAGESRKLARKKGWHVGALRAGLAGSRRTTGHYDGEDYFIEQGARRASAARTAGALERAGISSGVPVTGSHGGPDDPGARARIRPKLVGYGLIGSSSWTRT